MVNITILRKSHTKSCGCGTIVSGRHASGFTLVELVVVIAIIGILAAVAVPSFAGMVANTRSRTVATDLYLALVKARSEAVKRNMDVTLAPDAAGWGKGWQIYPTNTADNVLESHKVSGDVAVSGHSGNVKYNSSGRAGGSLNFNIKATVSSASSERCVAVSLSGLPNVKNQAC